MSQYVFGLSKPSDSGRHFVLLRFRDFPVNQFNFNFLHCLGLIDLLSANEHAEIFACILLRKKSQPPPPAIYIINGALSVGEQNSEDFFISRIHNRAAVEVGYTVESGIHC